MFSGGFGGAGGKRTSKSVRASNFVPATPILRSVQPKIAKTWFVPGPRKRHKRVPWPLSGGGVTATSLIMLNGIESNVFFRGGHSRGRAAHPPQKKTPRVPHLKIHQSFFAFWTVSKFQFFGHFSPYSTSIPVNCGSPFTTKVRSLSLLIGQLRIQ